jgi:hypothetical protein
MMAHEENGAAGGDTWPTIESLQDAAEPDLIKPAQLLRYLDESETGDANAEGGALPRITYLPEGIKVDERRVGRAVARWILHVRCDCGRRWFEVEAVDTTTCPRCGVLVYVDMDARSRRG